MSSLDFLCLHIDFSLWFGSFCVYSSLKTSVKNVRVSELEKSNRCRTRRRRMRDSEREILTVSFMICLEILLELVNRDVHQSLVFLDILTSPLPNDTTRIRAVVNARQLYVSCANEVAIDSSGTGSILSIVNQELGGWPILLGSSWSETSFNITRLMINLRQYSHNLIYSFGTSTDDRNSSVYYIRVRTTISANRISP